MRASALYFTAIIWSLFAQLNSAIYADEAYQLDFHYPLVGPPRADNTLFHRPSSHSKASLLYTLSHSNVLAAVNPKDGSLIWRQLLSKNSTAESTEGLIAFRDGHDTIFSAIGGLVQAWSASDGRLAWQSNYDGKAKALEVVVNLQGDVDITVFFDKAADSFVQKLSGSTGDSIWTQRISGAPSALIATEDSLLCLTLTSGLLGGHKLSLTKVDLQTGQILEQPAISTDNEVVSQKSILYAGNCGGLPLLVWIDKSLKTARAYVIGSKHATTVTIAAADGEALEGVVAHVPLASDAQPHFLLHYSTSRSDWAAVFHIDVKSRRATQSFELPALNGKGAFSVSTQGSDVYFIRHTASQLLLTSSTSHKPLSQWDITPASKDPAFNAHGPVQASSEVVHRGGSKFSLRSALVSASGDWTMVRNGEVLWERPESLVGAVSAAYVDILSTNLLEELAIESQQSVFAAYAHRLKRHLTDLQYLPGWTQAFFRSYLAKITGGSFFSSDDAGSLYYGFGFNKAIIVATESGRLAALDTLNQGKVLWNIQAVQLSAGEIWRVNGIEPAEDSVLIQGAHGESLRVSVRDGTVQAYQPGGLIPSLKTLITYADSQGRRVLIPILEDGSLGDLPDTILEDGTFFVTQAEHNTIQAWSFEKSNRPALSWTFMPGPGEDVRSAVARPVHDPIASIGKALGDRNVLYKYINPNLLLVTTVGTLEQTANFYLLDAASGAILYSTSHAHVDLDQPISSTITENWFAYSLFSQSNSLSTDPARPEKHALRAYQLIVSELFESPYPNDRGPLGAIANVSALHPPVLEDDRPFNAPYVSSQTFLIPGPISYLTTTSTLQGITPRALLCALPRSHAILSIPRFILDPRRPVGRDPTAAEAEEGLVRYHPLLEFEPKWMLNHKRDILSISAIIASPSKLESTSLVFAYGPVDLFGTRVSPIGSFDMLGKGFSKLQLVLTVVALAVGTGLLAPFARRKQIDGQWKA